MSVNDRRSSLLDIGSWLDKCSTDEPDSVIYDPEYYDGFAKVKRKQLEPELEKLYKAVVDCYSKIGLNQELIEERGAEVDEYLITCFNTLKNDVRGEYDKLCQYKEDLLKQVQKMLNDLYLPSYVPEDNITLLQHCKKLKAKHNELDVVKQKRINRLQELREKQSKHCNVLGIKPSQMKTHTDIPTEEELVKLAATVQELEKEEKRRKEKYSLLRETISRCIDLIEYEPQTEFEKNILTEKPDYSEVHLLKMTDFHSKLEAQHASNQQRFDTLKSRLEALYDRLDADQYERTRFFEEHNTCKPSSMIEMEVEIERYEVLKKQNIGKFIEKIKDELVIDYEKCFVAQEQQDNFFSLSAVSGECNEELLELYEREVARIKAYYNDNKQILEKFQKWRMMWKELIELEIKGNDPNRFNNRGGQLLAEEKKRKTLQKGLPKVEKELTALNEKHAAANNGKKVEVYNTDIEEFILGCWEELNNAKEEEKRERQRAKTTEPIGSRGRKQPQAQVLLKRTPTKRAAGAGITPTPSKLHCQRSVLGTPSMNCCKSNQNTVSGSIKKSLQKSRYPSRTDLTSRSQMQLQNSGKSQIPVYGQQVNRRDKTIPNSEGSEHSALSVSEQEFEDMIVKCPTSAKRTRQ